MAAAARIDADSLSHNRTPGPLQGWLLVAMGWLAVVSGLLLAPILPQMTSAFATTPNVDVKIRLVATLPALFVALLSVAWGLMADRWGRKPILLTAVGLYSLVGIAPFWLDSLSQIVASRACVGIAEAAILTCATAMIGDYFEGARRSRWLALQTGTAPIIATLMLALGGALGEQGWRIPFVAYGVTAIFVPVGLFCLWEPTRTVSSQPTESVVESPSMRWAPFLGICAITIFATTAFLVPIIQFAFLASERGMTSPASIGLWGAVSSVANMLGAVLFIAIRLQVKAKLALSFAAMGVGFAIMALGPGSESVVVGAAVANLGSGCIVPTLITWALAGLAATHRGMGTGLWMSANFLGQFLSPLIVLLLVRSLGTLDQAILVYAVFCGVAALVSLGARLWRSN